MNKISTVKDLIVWQKAHDLTLDTYKMIDQYFPSSEKFGLNSQLKRSIVSVPANISEGFKKRSIKDKIRFYNIAEGSLEESAYYFILAGDLGYFDTIELTSKAEKVAQLIQASINKLKQKI